ncbi:MAG: HlyD family efflux transporter periplasmic adaptor subunit [Rhizobiaceae bacterium]|nr:HlyD family efflux transporter periplasmic adaptor subunit [Rhizobiaceae bacterium]
MIRNLNKRQRPDTLVNQQRRGGGNWGRRIYLLILAVVCLTVLNYLWGEAVMLHADGLVIRERNLVAATSIVRVEDARVDQGETVEKDDILFRVGSIETLDRIADLSTRIAELAQRRASLYSRSELASELLPLARRRSNEASDVLIRFDNMALRGLVTTARQEEAMRANFDAQKELVLLVNETSTLKSEISAFEMAHQDAARALDDLKGYYASGIVRAPVSGTIGGKVPSVGDVYRAGEPILSIYSGEPYILAYLPTRYIFPIRKGMRVRLTSGRHAENGIVTEILPFSEALPEEFQNTFKPRDRNQLAKIHFAKPSLIPVYAKVEISRGFLW